MTFLIASKNNSIDRYRKKSLTLKIEMPHCKKSTCFRSSPRLKTDKTTIRNCNLRHKTWQPISKNTLTTKHLEKSQHDHPKQRKWEKRTLWKEIDLKLMKHKTSRVLPPSVKPIRHQICSSNNSTDSLKLPKYQEYANKQKRKNTFEHLQPHNDALSTAGFYYCGLKRLLKCFFCGISHDPFEFRSDDWKEICVLHAKRSSKCGFVLMQFGEIFLQEVEKKKKKVSDRMLYERLMSNLELNNDNNFLERDPAVLAVCELGYSRNAVQEIADLIIQETIRLLKERNNQLRQLFICKVCEQKNVQVLYLPCQHLVACADCATIRRTCLQCHNDICSLVRVFLG